MKKLPAVFLLVSLGLMLSACNTIHGAGKDIQKAGEVIQDSTKK
ncbi:MAG TPA: entericidin A/B family lipoprotein [Arenimonas sp.]|nr:entericidin A/B family lipoprotein [Arenimonas sp.]